MHEFIPVIKKSFVSRLKARCAQDIDGTLRNNLPRIQSPGTGTTQALPRSLNVPVDRVFPGPILRNITHKHLISFRTRKENSVSSVEKIWRANHNLGYNKMKCWVQLFSTPTSDTPGTTLLLHFDSKRYLIGNVGEGTQRAAAQRKLGMSKVSDIFLTGTIGWGTAGGLLGMILTLADSLGSAREELKRQREMAGLLNEVEEKQWLNIHGGKNLTHLLATARRFVFRKGMPVYTNEFRAGNGEPRNNWDPTWADDKIKVWALVISPEVHPANPRKRSHEEFSDESPLTSQNGNQETQEEEEDQDRQDQIRKSVVASMFDSEWRLDSLVKKKLSDVKMPATIFVRNSEGRIEKYTGPLPGANEDVRDIDVLLRNPWPGALVETLPPTTPSADSVSYIIKNHPQRGKFNPKEAIRLGVKPGPDFRKLTAGEAVTASDGSIITPDMVLAKGTEGGGFAVVDLPNELYIEPLISREEWSSKEIMNGIGAIVWILGPGVVEDSRLQRFMKNHGELKHVVSSEDCCSNYLALESPASAAIRLHLLDSDRFPIPIHSNVVPMHGRRDPTSIPYEEARLGKTLQLEPAFEVQNDKVVQYLDTANVINQTSKEVLELAELARKEVMSPKYQAQLEEHQRDIPCGNAEVTTLGTGSALPSKYRNVSATLLRVPGYGNYLFDCGENTLGQMKRVFGQELPEVFRELKAIWISHLHADHHLGTAAVIKAWHEGTKDGEFGKDRLMVVSDEAMIKWLEEYDEVESYGHDRVEPIIMGLSNRNFDHRLEPEESREFGLSSIQACQVEHCHGALAVVLNFPNGFKVAYSGDCRPSSDFVKIGKGATLLIHEATFDDELQGDAFAKKHCTTSEALNIGKQMDARRILLTHFSQRYQKIPVMDSKEGKDQVAIVAFDYMKVKICDIAKLEHFKPALIKLYGEKEDQ